GRRRRLQHLHADPVLRQGFGDLPDSYANLRPLAVTGTLGVAVPGRTSTTTRMPMLRAQGQTLIEGLESLRGYVDGRLHIGVPMLQPEMRRIRPFIPGQPVNSLSGRSNRMSIFDMSASPQGNSAQVAAIESLGTFHLLTGAPMTRDSFTLNRRHF